MYCYILNSFFLPSLHEMCLLCSASDLCMHGTGSSSLLMEMNKSGIGCWADCVCWSISDCFYRSLLLACRECRRNSERIIVQDDCFFSSIKKAELWALLVAQTRAQRAWGVFSYFAKQSSATTNWYLTMANLKWQKGWKCFSMITSDTAEVETCYWWLPP